MSNADVEDEVAHQESTKPYGEKDEKSFPRLVFYLKIVLSVEGKTCGDAHQHTDAVGRDIKEANVTSEKGVDDKVEERGETSDNAIQYQRAEAM